jgi:hypothetical protein
MDFSGTFDTTNALASMFLWLVFGLLSVMINCDIQRFIKTNPLFFHLFGLLAFFFLFTLLDTKNTSSIGIIWTKTVFLYFIFVCLIKSKWYFVLPVLGLLLIDQTIKKDISFKQNNDISFNGSIIDISMEKEISKYINNFIIMIILIGTMHYMYLQKLQHKERFSLFKFFFIINPCNKNNIDN